MTCIVGIAHSGTVYIAGDSAGVRGLDLTVRKDPKVFVNGEFVMGFTSSFRMGQLLQHAFKPPKRHPSTDVMTFMVTEFVNALRTCLKDGGFATRKDEGEAGGTFLVGYAGRLFVIEGDYQVGEQLADYHAVGCGEAFAIGALYATKVLESPTKRLAIALEAAEANSAGVRAPFNHVEGGAA